MKRGNFDQWGKFDQSGSFDKDANGTDPGLSFCCWCVYGN